MVLLVVRSGALRATPPTPPKPLPAEAKEVWSGIYGGGKKVGYSHRVRKPTADGFTVDSDTQINLAMMGTSQLVRTRLSAETDRSLRLRRFDFHLRSGTIDFAISGSVRGDTLEVESAMLGRQTVRLPSDMPVALTETLEDVLGGEKLETGKVFRYALFDPVSGAPAEVMLTVGPLERVVVPAGARSAYRIEEQFQGSTFRLWAESGGNVIKEEGPLGLTIVREASGEAAMAAVEGGVDLTAAAAIPVSRPIASPRTAQSLRLRVSGAPVSPFPPRQRLEGSAIVIERESLTALSSYPLPQADSRFADDLAATPFLQIADPKVRALREEILGAERDAERTAAALAHWVFHNLAKVPTISVPNALQVIAERKGDCNEHAALYAALARSAGLPARIVSGVVYMPGDSNLPGAFYYHAWNEVWLGEWTTVDPTFDQLPADATHLKLVEGGPDKDVALLGVIGKLRLDVETSS